MTAAAAAALMLTACAAGSTGASQDPTETSTAPTSTAPTTATPTSTASSTASTSTAATSSAAPSPTTPSPSRATTSATARPAPAAGKLLDFHGIHLLLPVEQTDLPGIPDGLRTALATGLKKRWDAYGDAPACQHGPVYVVNKVDTGGWASIDAWDDPSVSGPKCAGVGGGYTGFWALVNGSWQEVIVSQQLPACATFAKYRFPVSIAGDKCAASDGSEVTYSG